MFVFIRLQIRNRGEHDTLVHILTIGLTNLSIVMGLYWVIYIYILYEYNNNTEQRYKF